MDEKTKEIKTSKKTNHKIALVATSVAMWIIVIALPFIKGFLLFFSLKYIAFIFLSTLPFCIAFHNKIMEAGYKLDEEKEKMREKEPEDIKNGKRKYHGTPQWLRSAIILRNKK